jgi:hypothetical protein
MNLIDHIRKELRAEAARLLAAEATLAALAPKRSRRGPTVTEEAVRDAVLALVKEDAAVAFASATVARRIGVRADNRRVLDFLRRMAAPGRVLEEVEVGCFTYVPPPRWRAPKDRPVTRRFVKPTPVPGTGRTPRRKRHDGHGLKAGTA